MIRPCFAVILLWALAPLLGCRADEEALPPETAAAAQAQVGADPAPNAIGEQAFVPDARQQRASADEAAIQAVLDAIMERWNKVDSFAATVTITGKMPIGPLMLSTRGSGPAESTRIDGKRLFRMEIPMEFSSDMPAMGRMTGRMLTVNDGEATYLEMEMMGQKKVGRTTLDKDQSQPPQDGKAMFDALREKGRLSLLPDATIDGAPLYVLELELKQEQTDKAPGKPVLMRLYYAKDSGLATKVESFDEAGDLVASRTYSDVAINPELDQGRFVYTPPPGVEVEDVKDKGGLPKFPF